MSGHGTDADHFRLAILVPLVLTGGLGSCTTSRNPEAAPSRRLSHFYYIRNRISPRQERPLTEGGSYVQFWIRFRRHHRPVRSATCTTTRAAAGASATAMTAMWTPHDWRACPIAQAPIYPDEAALDAVEAELRVAPPLIFAGVAEVRLPATVRATTAAMPEPLNRISVLSKKDLKP